MKCPACGAPLVEGARFCASCGVPLQRRSDERRVVTVLFADLVGFTILSETRDPEQVKNLVDDCFERLVADIDAFGGQVDKIVGDAILALFGAPVAHEDDAERAVRAALRMQRTIADCDALAGAGGLRMRIGINTGEVLVGALRAGGDYTAMGDVVNSAQRLQTTAQPGQIVVGSATHAATRHVVRYTELGPVDARGRDEPIDAWAAEEALLPPGRAPAGSTRRWSAATRSWACSPAPSTRPCAAGARCCCSSSPRPGMGKTRLAEEVAAVAESDHGVTVLEGRCVPYGEANVWWPVAEALRSTCEVNVGDAVDVAQKQVLARTQAGLPAATDAEVERVTNGLLHLMGYEVRSAASIPPAPEKRRGARCSRSSRAGPTSVRWSWCCPTCTGPTITCSTWPTTARTAGQRSRSSSSAPPAPTCSIGGSRTSGATTNSSSTSTRCRAMRRATCSRPSPRGPSPTSCAPRCSIAAAATRSSSKSSSRCWPRPRPRDDDPALPEVGLARVAAHLARTRRGAARRPRPSTSGAASKTPPCSAVAARSRRSQIMGEEAHRISSQDVEAAIAGLVAEGSAASSKTARWSFRSDLVREVAYGMLTKADRARRHFGVAKWMESHNITSPADVDRIAHHYATSATLIDDLGFVADLPEEIHERGRHVARPRHDPGRSGRAASRRREAEHARARPPPMCRARAVSSSCSHAPRPGTNMRDLDQAPSTSTRRWSRRSPWRRHVARRSVDRARRPANRRSATLA